ncbi:MAG: class I SAM-dependent methyltransferase [Oscillospiraceae bacterium]|nr:class I SAM-dependent methyltransferase [Oscillospiraceae bacterium]
MKNTNIGSRLLMAASFVQDGKTVCDVGCDHGKLSLYLIKEGKARRIIATDINAKPLQKAVDLFSRQGLSDKARFYLTDGLDGIDNSDGEISHIVIAGLGGTTMKFILDNAPWVKSPDIKLVLLPAQSGYTVREWLYSNGFEIEKETTVEEKGKYYSCMCAVYTGKNTASDVFDIYLGKSGENTGDSAKGYFELIMTRLKKEQKGFLIETGAENPEYSKAINKLQTLIDGIK